MKPSKKLWFFFNSVLTDSTGGPNVYIKNSFDFFSSLHFLLYLSDEVRILYSYFAIKKNIEF